ncbi:cation:proton antiporter regulatory subunit [Parafrigoribacterium mesophilum]|uniref:cation:proton antiporter regulatory subunit n=1 Tax=Parafrigoribacterium mesophilum TaxID=433646 RepID=UPI0031FE2D51
MGVRIEKTDLPGIGVRHDLVTARGRRIGVVTYRDGSRELSIFDIQDPDACAFSIPMSDAEAATLSDILGASFMLSKLTELTDEAAGLFTEHLLVPTDSNYAGRPLGATQARSRTGASIVAIVRDKQVIASPTPNDVIEAGDSLVAVGTRQGLDSLADLIASSTG